MLRFIWLLILIQNSLFALVVDDSEPYNELLYNAKILIDENRSETIETVQNKKFEDINTTRLTFSYSPKFDVWIRFTLSNPSDHHIHKIIEYDDSLTTEVSFFEGKKLIKKEGLANNSQSTMSLNPIMEATLAPHQSQVFYIKASTKITAMIIQLNLWSHKAFYHKELKHQIILALFFGAMLITILYNLTVYIGTRDVSYIYYVLFFVGVTVHHLVYKGVASLYLLPPEVMNILITYSSVIVAFPVIFLALFTRNILMLQQYPRLNRILIALLILYPVVIILIRIFEAYQYRNILFAILLIYLLSVTIYALIQKNHQARFIIFGIMLFVSSGIFMLLSSKGYYNVFETLPYLSEVDFTLETVIFSLALASKINMLNQEKVTSQKRALLLKELNHRFKNSMQTILSFLFFQKEKIENKKVHEILTNLENRIMATTQLYSLLHAENNMIVVDTEKYFTLIVENIQESFAQENITIEIHTDVTMHSEYVVYCGLIVNEAVTNAFKYAFKKNRQGKITISLEEQNNHYHLTIKDDGKGFNKQPTENNLGLYIIETLATLQLEGTLTIQKENGVQIDVVWKKAKHDTTNRIV